MRCIIVVLALWVLAESATTKEPSAEDGEDSSAIKEGAEEDEKPTTSDDACTHDDGSKGQCVVYYQCDAETKNLITDGSTLIDVRFSEERPCVQYLHVCCGRELVNRTQVRLPTTGGAAAPCGRSDPGASGHAFRISNTDVAEFAEYPWMLAILKKETKDGVFTASYVAGASLIHPRVALTSAHKVYGLVAGELKVRAGEWDTQTEQEPFPHQEVDVQKLIVHDKFHKPSVKNSVALVVTSAPFQLAPHVGVACVARAVAAPGTTCYSMGWGSDDFGAAGKYAVVLKKVPVPIVSREKCQTSLRGTRLGSHFVLHSSFVCAGGKAGVDTCKGDGGSPLVCPIPGEAGRFAVVGTVAWGIGCKDAVPGVYTDVTQFRDWIEERLRGEGLTTDSFDKSRAR